MENFNIKDVDFYSLDIHKYLDWLLKRYKLFSTIWELPFLDNIIINYHYRKYLANSHYLLTRLQSLPEHIERLYDEKIKHFESQTEKYRDIKLELIFFESVKYDKETAKTGKTKDYIFFSKNELKNIKIDLQWINFFLVEHIESSYEDLIDEINDRKKASPLQDTLFYQKELNNLLNDYEFEFLPRILEGAFIYNLDDMKNALSFSTEIDRIRQAKYLCEMIRGGTHKHSLTKPLKWKGNVNSLATLFSELLESGIIEGSKENIKRLLLNNFINSENQDLSKSYIDDIFKSMKGKKDSKTIENLKPLLSYLTENRPQ